MQKKIALYGLLAALAMIFGFIESLFPLTFIAPGVKLGLANGVALFLLCKRDFKGALLVNSVRIILSALLFSSPFSLLFSLTAGLSSTLIMYPLSRTEKTSAIGVSILGAAVHNSVQLTVAAIIYSIGVLYYLPILLVSALITGGLIGITVHILDARIKLF